MDKTSNDDEKPLVIAVTGPTASGKTDLAIKLSRHLPVELINMDSAQIYRDMDIGTAKISQDEQRDHPHHLMNILSPEESYSVAQFVRDVGKLVPEINHRGNIPILVGGSVLYYKALTDGLANLPKADEALRKKLRRMMTEQGHEALRRELAQIDPESADQIQGKDSQRLIRFVEIARLTGQPPSVLFKQQQEKNINHPFRFFHICCFPDDRAWLHERIERRFDKMLAQGFVDEVIRLRKKYRLTPELPAMRCAGYRQIWDYLEGRFDHLPTNKSNKHTNTAYQEMRNRGIFATRQLAKRQLTWLRKIPAEMTLSPPKDYCIHSIIEQINRNFFQMHNK
ncbi:MAG: tRNA (adenosine(37)-N6)-dimethylallyltransferase MiaA [Gammaproteobacteria bacterium]|nr:MAG: tRNA (adenosine(37)-N6)-dimethylallyltransferase MiaA [Gammaproteobacteria bacterium]